LQGHVTAYQKLARNRYCSTLETREVNFLIFRLQDNVSGATLAAFKRFNSFSAKKSRLFVQLDEK